MAYTLNGREVVEMEVDDVDPNDYPDFADARISYAVYLDNGEELTAQELDQFMEKYFELAGEMAFDHLL
jgi:hypothetical protein